MNLARLAKARLELGDQQGALANHEECRLIHRKASRHRASYTDQCAVVDNLASVGDLRYEVGDDEGALQAYEGTGASRTRTRKSRSIKTEPAMEVVPNPRPSRRRQALAQNTSGALIAYEQEPQNSSATFAIRSI